MPGASTTFGRRVQLLVLYALDVLVVGLLYYLQTVQYFKGTYIASATITLNSTYKIAGISGGPIAGKINDYRTKLQRTYQGAMVGYAIVSTAYLIAAMTEYYRRHKNEHFVASAWNSIFAAIYVIGWLATFAVSCIGLGIFVADKSHTKISGASFEAKDGAKISAGVAVLLLAIGLWRVIMHAVRTDDQPKEPSRSSGQEMQMRDNAPRIFV